MLKNIILAKIGRMASTNKAKIVIHIQEKQQVEEKDSFLVPMLIGYNCHRGILKKRDRQKWQLDFKDWENALYILKKKTISLSSC